MESFKYSVKIESSYFAAGTKLMNTGSSESLRGPSWFPINDFAAQS